MAVVQGMGLDFGALAVLFGALGVGLGFGLQDLTRNLSSGLTLLIEGKLKVGDLIEFEGTQGFIREISFRSTVIRTFQGSEIVLPNAMITNAPVHNLSYASPEGRVDVMVSVLHGSDPLVVTEALLKAALAAPEVLADPAPRVLLHQIGPRGLDFELWVWTGAISSQLLLPSALNYAIQQGLVLRGIHLVGSGARRWVAAGEVLIHKGEEGRALYLVLQGWVDAIHETERISRQLFSFGTGEFFGELLLLMQMPYPTSMRALEDSLLFEIPSGSVRDLLATRPDFAEVLAQAVARRGDVLRSYEHCLRERGLLTDGDIGHPLQWMREKLRRMLAGGPGSGG